MRRIALVGALAATVACGTTASRRGEQPPYYDSAEFTPKWSPVSHHIGDFALTTQTGGAVRGADLAGRLHVASFIFTTCPSICPTLVAQLKRVQEETKDVPELLLVSYSVTPAIDTPERLSQFGRERGIDAARWLLVTGDAAQIASLARDSYFADDSRVDRSAAGSARVLHTEKLLLVDGEGHLRGLYNGTLPHEVNRLIEDIHALRGPVRM